MILNEKCKNGNNNNIYYYRSGCKIKMNNKLIINITKNQLAFAEINQTDFANESDKKKIFNKKMHAFINEI